MFKDKKSSESSKIYKTINTKFKKNKLKKSFEGVQMFNDIRLLADNSNVDLDLYLYGLNVAIPVINAFIDFKDGFDLEKINKITLDSSIRSLYISNQEDSERIHGINALDIKYIALNDSLHWGSNFEEFLKTKELKITKWVNPIEQIIFCILLAEIFECYFDLDHFLKSAATVLFMDDQQLKRFCIKRSSYKKYQHLYLEERLTDNKQKKILSSLKSTSKYRTTYNVGYPYIKKFAQTLPFGLENYLHEAIKVFSPQTKKDFTTKFKNAEFLLKLLMLVFNKKDISKEALLGFKGIYKSYIDKTFLINHELKKLNYDDFESAMLNYLKVTKGVHGNNREIEKLNIKGVLQELINYQEDSPGPLIQKALGFIPSKNCFLKKEIEFKGYEIKQVCSRPELIAVGEEFSNCLKNYANYHQSLQANGISFLAFRHKSKKKNFGSFVVHLDLNNRQCKILEMKRKGNRQCTLEERAILQEFLINMNLINIPDEFFAHYTMRTFTEIASKNLENGITDVIENAPIIYALLKKLKNSKQWFYDVDGQILTEDVKAIVRESLEKQNGMKAHLENQRNQLNNIAT